jgi:hypothetical protein
MNDSRLRAPFRVLEELLGDADEDSGDDKTSTQFVYAFEGEEFAAGRARRERRRRPR